MELQFTIHSYSSYSHDYSPDNIFIQEPHSLTSRWTSLKNYNEFLILKLEQPSLVTAIEFGKY